MPKRKQVNTAVMRAAKVSAGFNPANANILQATTAVFTQQLQADIINNSLSRKLKIVSNDYDMLNIDSKVLVNASTNNVTIKLPDPATSKGASYSIGKIDSSNNKVIILPYSTETIASELSINLLYTNELLELVTDGINWYIGG